MLNVWIITAMIVIVVYSMLIAFFRKLSKSRIRGITLIVSAVLAVVTTISLRSTLASQSVMNKLIAAADTPMVSEFMGISETMSEVLINCAASLLAPMVCLLLYIVYSIVTWVIYCVITIVLKPTFKRYDRAASASRARSLVWGAVSGIVTIFILFIPVASYTEIAIPVIETVAESGELGQYNSNVLKSSLESEIKPANEGAIEAFRAVGGNAICGALTDFEINGEKVALGKELGSILNFVNDIMKLSGTAIKDVDHSDSEVFTDMADSFEDSVLLPTIVGDVVYGITDHWIKGTNFAGFKQPDLGEDAEIAQPFVDKLVEILHDDAKNEEALEADFRTIAKIVVICADNDIFKSFSNTDALMIALGNQGFLNGIISEIGANSTMKALIPEITNMGLRAIANALDVPDGDQQAYTQMMDALAGSLNEVKDLSEEERNEKLTNDVEQALKDAGIEVVPEQRETISTYVADMSTELIDNSDKEELTAEDVKDFLAKYALTMDTSNVPA